MAATIATLPESERQFQAAVIEYARMRGWSVAHFHDSRRQVGGKLVGDADAAGFPDLVLTRRGRLIFAELKTTAGRLSDAQKQWIADLALVKGESFDTVRVFLWRPSDWTAIEALLR